MTRAEKAVVERLEDEIRLLRAFRWSDEVRADVLPTQHSGEVRGWFPDFFPNDLSQELRVTGQWSRTDCYGELLSSSGGSKGSRSLHSTRLAALQALRGRVVKKCAEWLARVDDMIDAEISCPKDLPERVKRRV